jgi:hypothetical protein
MGTGNLSCIVLPCDYSNCVSCFNATYLCDDCLSGFALQIYFNGTVGCEACTILNCSNCSFISSTEYCNSCDSGLTLNSNSTFCCLDINCEDCSNNPNICVICIDNYYIAANNSCNPCSEINHCLNCSLQNSLLLICQKC